MCTTCFSKGDGIKVRYQLGTSTNLVWFEGSITRVTSKSVTIRFNKNHGFNESSVRFNLTTSDQLTDEDGNIFPYSIDSNSNNALSRGHNTQLGNELSKTQSTSNPSPTPLHPVTFKRGLHLDWDDLLSILSLKLNKSLHSFPKNLKVLSSDGYLTKVVLSASIDCSLQHVRDFILQLKQRTLCSEQTDPSICDLFPTSINIDLQTFQNVSTLFLINHHFKNSILYASKFNHNKKLSYCTFLGSYEMNLLNENNLLLSFAKNTNVWKDGNIYYRKSNNQSMDKFIAPLKILTDRHLFDSLIHPELLSSHSFKLTWSSLMENSITNFHCSKTRTFGTLTITIPFVQVKHSNMVRELDQLMNIKFATSSDSDTSSDNN